MLFDKKKSINREVRKGCAKYAKESTFED
jgi:hypothetical protein